MRAISINVIAPDAKHNESDAEHKIKLELPQNELAEEPYENMAFQPKLRALIRHDEPAAQILANRAKRSG